MVQKNIITPKNEIFQGLELITNFQRHVNSAAKNEGRL